MFQPKSFIFLLTVILLTTCIDPYIPELSEYDPMLVVEGLITNENKSYKIKLSWTYRKLNRGPIMVPDATVSIFDENGKVTKFINNHNGVYSSDSTQFIGKTGSTYTLNIHTRDGKEYKSDFCEMLPVSKIDTIYFEKNMGFTGSQSEIHQGISIYIGFEPGVESTGNFRWEYEETWKYSLPNPKRFDYISESEILPVKDWQQFCWKKQNSSEVLINSYLPDQMNLSRNQPICFIASDLSDRLSVQYSILAKQYSISYKEYEFWRKLKKVSESGGDIFGFQPFPVTGNIHNVSNPEETVLGYFQVSAVTQKRKYITFRESIIELNLPLYRGWYYCSRIEASPEEYAATHGKTPTFDELYRMWTHGTNYNFIEPVYDPPGKLSKLVFSQIPCSVCQSSSNIKKPDYWVDLY